MGLHIFGAPLCAYACVCLFVSLLQAAHSQTDTSSARRSPQSAPLRQTLQWSHNGQLFSILSHGSEYQPARRRGAAHEQVHSRPVTIIRDEASQQQQQQPPQQRPRPASNGLPVPLQRLLRGHARRNGTSNETQHKATVSPSPLRREDMMVGDDPYDPYKSIDYENPYYNHYDVYEQPRRRPRPGYGTRYHQYGKRMQQQAACLLLAYAILAVVVCNVFTVFQQ